jgi:hypothetical protein
MIYRPHYLAACVVYAAIASLAEAEPPHATQIARGLVAANQGYFPVALRLQDGRIAVVLRGGDAHVGIRGRLDMVFSSDEGATWSKPVVVVDTPVDDRNPALGQATDGTLVLAYWQYNSFDEQGRPYRPLRADKVSTWVTRSTDGGKTWSDSLPIDVADIRWGSPFGRMLTLPDGAMLLAIYGSAVQTDAQQPASTVQVGHIYRSTDMGKSWKRWSTLGPRCAEPALARLQTGKIVAAVRTSDSGGVALMESTDDGRTWSAPKRLTPDSVHPGDLLPLPDGRMLLMAGYRVGDPFGVCGMVSDASGTFDWQHHFLVVDDLLSRDCGYPSSVLLKDGRVLTVYYGRSKEHPEWRMHCGAVTFQLSEKR